MSNFKENDMDQQYNPNNLNQIYPEQYKKRQNSQSQNQSQAFQKIPKNRGTVAMSQNNNNFASQNPQDSFVTGFSTEGNPNHLMGASAKPTLDNNNNNNNHPITESGLPAGYGNPSNQTTGGVIMNPSSGLLNNNSNPNPTLADTLQTCYTNILELEKRNQHYNMVLNQSIFTLGQVVKQVVGEHNQESTNFSQQSPSSDDGSFSPGGQARFEATKTQINQKHVSIQKTLVVAYSNNLELLDAYYDFVLYALRGGSSAADGGSLSSSTNSKSINNIFSGYQVLQVYKISRRLWIYGIINLLENMKNFITVVMAIPRPYQDSNNQNAAGGPRSKGPMIHLENELCVNFISHCFSLLSTLVEMNNNLTIEVDSDPAYLANHLVTSSNSQNSNTDPFKVSSTLTLIADFQNWWYEKIADLSRMSIALYPSSCIDWEVSSEHWYTKAISGSYGHGKIYYHLATVQQPSNSDPKTNTAGATQGYLTDPTFASYGGVSQATASGSSSSPGNDIALEALFNIGKSVFVKDCFVPTGHYLRVVLDSMFSQSRIYSYTLYESAIVHLSCGNGTILIDKNKVTAVDNLSNWELIILLYIRVSKILLAGSFNAAPELIKLVSTFARSFGNIDFIASEDFPPFGEYSNAKKVGGTNPPNFGNSVSNSLETPTSLDPFANNHNNKFNESERNWSSSNHQNQYNHQAIRVSFFEKDSPETSPTTNSSNFKSMLIEKPSIKLLNFWFNKSGNLASINIWQVVGFGVLNFKNLFSILFELPIALKERQERKETKKNRKASSASVITNNDENQSVQQPPTSSIPQTTTIDYDSLLKDPYPVASEMNTYKWLESLRFINRSSLELSFRMLRKFLSCPFKSVSTPHVIVWCYFLIAVGKAAKKNPEVEPVVIDLIFKKFFPWESFVGYLNFWLNEARECFDFDNLPRGFKIMDNANKSEFLFEQNLVLQIKEMYSLGNEGFLDYFNEHETLIEVWKLWGSLWYNSISEKKNYLNLKFAGWNGKDFAGDYINNNEELLYIVKPDLNSQENMQRSHNTNNNYFRDLFSEGEKFDRVNSKINAELYEKEVEFYKKQQYRNGTFNPNAPVPEKNDRRLFNSVEKERTKRVLLLGIYIAQTFPFYGLKLTDRQFKLDVDHDEINFDTGEDSIKQEEISSFIAEFITDSRFEGINEPISEGNILNINDKPFNIDLFLKSKDNYDHMIEEQIREKAQKNNNFVIDEDDDKSMVNSEYSKMDVSMNLVNNNRIVHTDVDSSIIDETDSLLNYNLATKALGVDSNLINPHEHPSLNEDSPTHLISPDVILKSSPFGAIHTKTLDDFVPYSKFYGNITSDIDTSLTYVTFDTNSWLKNCGKIYKIFKTCTLNDNVKLKLKIALPLLIYQELRSLRKSEDSFLSDSATRCVITIKALYNDHMAYFQKKINESNIPPVTHLLLLKPDGKITGNLNEVFEPNVSFKVVDDSILASVLKSSNHVRDNYINSLKEKFGNLFTKDSTLELDDGKKKISANDMLNFRFNILITDTRPLRLKARSVSVNAYQCKWLFYNLEKINLESACLD